MLSTLGTVINSEITLFGHESNRLVNSYRIPMEDLAEYSNSENRGFPTLLEALSNHEWIEMANLYFLAKIINKTCPELHLDWYNQFMKLEEKIYERKMMKQYLESLGIKKEPRHVSEPDFQMWWINYSIFCANTQKKDPIEIIQDRVRNNLAKNNLM